MLMMIGSDVSIRYKLILIVVAGGIESIHSDILCGSADPGDIVWSGRYVVFKKLLSRSG